MQKMKDLKGYLKEGVPIQALKYNHQPVSLQLPVYVELKVTYTEPAVKGEGSLALALSRAGLMRNLP